jgi:CCR4-NOT transcriptional complex subunit CAF120
VLKIETLPTRNEDVQPLQNVLSISTAGKNRYLLHFNSFHSLTQWTAGIRLSMFENASLQELYTGSLIAGKGKLLNNIRVIMEKSKLRSEDWARVRFGAGTPWRRCWCVIDPPNEKDHQKESRPLKKRSAYERPAILKGDIKFYDTKKTKKMTPIATITDAYSAYAIYPQAKPLIDQSTLVKVEGRITIHSDPESKTEGFVFVMPEVHPAVSGFEIMLRWLFPVYDTFGLYGRPSRLIADTLDSRGLMFAMPKERRYGYLDIQDVAALVCQEGSQSWSEQEWRKQMKDVTSKRLSSTGSRATSRQGSRKGLRTSLPAGANLRYEDGASVRSTPSHKHNQSTDTVFATPRKNRTTGAGGGSLTSANYHARSASDTLAFSNSPRKRPEQYTPSRLSVDQDSEAPLTNGRPSRRGRPGDLEIPKPPTSFDNEPQASVVQEADEVGSELRPQPPPTPVAAPPAFLHSPGEKPNMLPNASPDLRRANSRMSTATLSQLVDASRFGTTPNGAVAVAGAAAAWKNNEDLRSQDQAYKGVNETTNRRESPADQRLLRQGLVAGIHHSDANITTGQTRHQPQSNSAQRPDELVGSATDKSIARKPVHVDQATNLSKLNMTPKGPTDAYIGMVNNPTNSEQDKHMANAQHTRETNSNHDDDTSLDYASTSESSQSKNSDPTASSKQGNGVLRTVGNPNHVETPPTNLQTDISSVHVATTQTYLSGVRNGNGSGTLEPRNASSRWNHSRTPSDPLTLKDERRSLYLGRLSPNNSANSREQSNSPGPRDGAVAWVPGSAAVVGRKSPGPRTCAEEFVQQRTSATPAYAQQKNRSAGYLPQERPKSADLSKRKEVGSRPSSRDATATLGPQQDYTSHLSAREQEHVARMTNSPLVDMSSKKQQSPQASTTLVGAIQAREQEKKQVRQGISGQMVQHAIAQRQQQYQTHQQNVQAQQQAPAQAISPQQQAYEAQVAAGFFGHAQAQPRGAPGSPGGWAMPANSQPWPNVQAPTHWGGQLPQQPTGGGQQKQSEGQTRVRKQAPGQK